MQFMNLISLSTVWYLSLWLAPHVHVLTLQTPVQPLGAMPWNGQVIRHSEQLHNQDSDLLKLGCGQGDSVPMPRPVCSVNNPESSTSSTSESGSRIITGCRSNAPYPKSLGPQVFPTSKYSHIHEEVS